MKRQTLVRHVLIPAILMLLAATPAAALAQSGSYTESFDNGAPGWKLDSGWSTGGGLLSGANFGSAIYGGPAGWHDAHYQALLRNLEGNAYFLFLYNSDGWFELYLGGGASQVSVQLYYTRPGEEFPPLLGSAGIDFPGSDFKTSGLPVEVDVQGRDIDVSLNGQSLIHYTADFDTPGGTIGFTATGQSVIDVDYVSVEPPAVTEPPPRTAPTQGPDLAITDISLNHVRQGSVIVDLSVEVTNLGDTESPPTILVVFDRDQSEIRVQVPVDGLPPGDSRGVDVSLEGPDQWANTNREFVAQIDPEHTSRDSRPANNELTSGSLYLDLGGGPVQPPQPSGPSVPSEPSSSGGPGSGFVTLVVGGLGVLGLAVAGGTALAIRSQMKIGQRQRLQKEAQHGKPPDHCTPPGRYVEVETEVDLKLMQVTGVEIALLSSSSKSTRRKQAIKDKLPGDVNAAIHARWLREPEEKAAERITGLAKDMAKAIETQAYREQDPCDVAVTAHLEGLEVTSTFTLYHCIKDGPNGVWKEVNSWKVSKKQERDDPLLGLAELDTGATSMADRLRVLIEPQIRDFLARY